VTIITAQLEEKQLQKVVNYIYQFFQKNDIKKVLTQYGWECDIDIDEQYKDIEINTSDINKFINKSQKDKIFILGKSDLYITDPKKSFEFQLCHESDVHFKTANKWNNMRYSITNETVYKYKNSSDLSTNDLYNNK